MPRHVDLSKTEKSIYTTIEGAYPERLTGATFTLTNSRVAASLTSVLLVVM